MDDEANLNYPQQRNRFGKDNPISGIDGDGIGRALSLVVSSLCPKAVAKACGDLLNVGYSPEVILQSGGWLETTLTTLLKWTGMPQFQRRVRLRRGESMGKTATPASYRQL